MSIIYTMSITMSPYLLNTLRTPVRKRSIVDTAPEPKQFLAHAENGRC